MKTTILLTGMLVSFNVAGAAVYEFTREPEPRSAPEQSPVKPKPPTAKPAAAAPATAPVSTAVPREQQDAVAQTPGCAGGAACNDL